MLAITSSTDRTNYDPPLDGIYSDVRKNRPASQPRVVCITHIRNNVHVSDI